MRQGIIVLREWLSIIPLDQMLSSSRTLLLRVILYNDGCFDVSPNGKIMCGCTELFLPNSVKSVMEKTDDHDDRDEMGTAPTR